MKLSVKPENLKYLILGAGGLGLALRVVLYSTGIDEKGLLISGHWAGTALWLLTALAAAALILLTGPIQGPERYQDAHPVSFTAGLGCFALSAGILITTLSEMSASSGNISLIVRLLGFASIAAASFIGFCRIVGAIPHSLCHATVCLYFALRMVSQYQNWSSDPQLQDYIFYLSAYVALMLTGYHHAAFDAQMGSHRALWALSLGAVYLCCLSLKGTADTALLLAAAVWAFTNLTALTGRPRRHRPVLQLEEDPREEV